jgi:indolepyruvate ferredoxin oxidoreductase, alpha subunit
LKAQNQSQIEFLLGNEAIAYGAVEAQVDFVAGYPGTPSSEIIETLSKLAKDRDIHVEWSTNEQVAFENALGASLAGRRSMVTMKHAGFNWIADPLSVAVMSGVQGGLVIVSGDDPGCHTSANEQDSRVYGTFFNILTLEPWDPKSAREMAREAFELSERSNLPVIVRSVTRVSHSRSDVRVSPFPNRREAQNSERDPSRFFITGNRSLKASRWLIEQQSMLGKISNEIAFNTFERNKNGSLCVIASGVAASYVEDIILHTNEAEISFIRLGCAYPIPSRIIEDALSRYEKILVLEEGAPVVEQQIRNLASHCRRVCKIIGKLSGEIPKWGELTIPLISLKIKELLSVSATEEPVNESQKDVKIPLPSRSMVFCAGCPHTGTMYSIKKACKSLKEKPFIAGDIGCYTLMIYPPHELGDAKFSMGASISVAAGYSKAKKEKSIAVIGDSTFIHAGVPGLINCVYNESDVLVIICDNRTTGMTGGQPHAGIGITATGEKTKHIIIENLVRGCGVEYLEIVDPYNIKSTVSAIKKGIKHKGIGVIIAQRNCALQVIRGKAVRREALCIDENDCNGCLTCIQKLACPALLIVEGTPNKVRIDQNQCTGCTICAQICPFGAIK